MQPEVRPARARRRFTVWAPRPRRVDVVADGSRYEMSRQDHGCWKADVVTAGPGTRYGFSLDGREPRPDPRSASQPDGVLGLSELVDHSSFGWTDSHWRGRGLDGLLLYELHVGTFSPEGTFDGAVERLDHLVDLGIDAVEVMPVVEFSGDRGWGYDGVDLYAPHHGYGGPDGFKRFVDACHGHGLAVVLDVVYNHLGPIGNFLAEFGPYFSHRHRTAWGPGVNFDEPGSSEVRRFVLDNATMWIRDYHVDGLRLDATHAIVDESPQHILEALAAEVHAAGEGLNRETFVIAESGVNDPRLIRTRAEGGYGLDASWADDWHHALHTILTGEQEGYYAGFGSPSQLVKALRQAWVRGRPPDGLPPSALLVSLQNHDQVGNRATGDRLSALVDEGRLRLAAALLLTSPFTPMLFQGEEWAARTPFLYFTGHADEGVGRAVSEGRRQEFAEFGWAAEQVPDPQDPSTFVRSKLDWNELDEPFHRRMLDWYRELISLRRRLPPPPAHVGERVTAAVDEAGRLEFARPGVVLRATLGAGDWTFAIMERDV